MITFFHYSLFYHSLFSSIAFHLQIKQRLPQNKRQPQNNKSPKVSSLVKHKNLFKSLNPESTRNIQDGSVNMSRKWPKIAKNSQKRSKFSFLTLSTRGVYFRPEHNLNIIHQIAIKQAVFHTITTWKTKGCDFIQTQTFFLSFLWRFRGDNRCFSPRVYFRPARVDRACRVESANIARCVNRTERLNMCVGETSRYSGEIFDRF